MAVIRLFFMAFLVLTVIYVGISVWSRLVRKAKLRRQWLEDGARGDREAFVRAGLEDYDGSLRRKLILGVYVIPMVLVAVIIYIVNYT